MSDDFRIDNLEQALHAVTKERDEAVALLREAATLLREWERLASFHEVPSPFQRYEAETLIDRIDAKEAK